MRWLFTIIVLFGSAACVADEGVSAPAQFTCSNSPGAPACKAAAKDLKAARHAFSRGLKYRHEKNLDGAFEQFEEASRLIPQNVEYLTAREMLRQELVSSHIEHGNDQLQNGKQIEALADFREALQLDPQNEFARQRLQDAVGTPPVRTASPPQLVASVDALASQPKQERHDFHYRGDSRGLITAIATSFGLTVIFDDTFPNRRVHF